MLTRLFIIPLLFFIGPEAGGQSTDSLESARLAKMVNLSEVVIKNGVNIPAFIQHVKNDTTFYKAFRNLRVIGFTALNDIRILNKKGTQQAGLQSKTRQTRNNNCREMEVLEESTQGNFYDAAGHYTFYTAELYAGLFFTKGKVCNETNIVKGVTFSPKGKKGMEKNKEQLKLLFFNPGKKIPGIPLMSDKKIDIFDPDVAEYYNFSIDYADYEGRSCYVFAIQAREDLRSGQRDKIVIDDMTTWFDVRTMEVMKRNYSLSYDAGVYDFDVTMEVELTKVGEYLVPKTLRYKGNWDVMLKKRERGVFTATLFDFVK